MSYLPTPAQLAAMGFTLARQYTGEEYNTWQKCTEWRVMTSSYALIIWPRRQALRLCANTARAYEYLFTGPVADEAAFRALVARHFPALI